MVTVTPGSAPPVASLISPLIVPVWAGCANDGAAMATSAAISKVRERILNILIPSSPSRQERNPVRGILCVQLPSPHLTDDPAGRAAFGPTKARSVPLLLPAAPPGSYGFVGKKP